MSLLADAAPPDAVITGPRTFAAGFANAARALGLSIPDDLMLADSAVMRRPARALPPR